MAKKRAEEEEKQPTAEDKYKRNKRAGILAIAASLFAVASLVILIVVNGRDGEGAHQNIASYIMTGMCGVIAMAVGIYFLATAKKKYQKQLAEEQAAEKLAEENAAAPVQGAQTAGVRNASAASGPDISGSEAGDKLTEAHGADINEMMKNPQSVEKLSFRTESGEVLTYDFLWGNVYGGVTYLVVGRMEEAYTKYIIFVSPADPTVCYCELNDGVREVIKNDFDRAVGAYAQGGGMPAEQKAESVGRFARLKMRFVSGKPDTGKKQTFVIMLILYGVILMGGLSTYFTAPDGDGNGALIKALCLAYMLITPSFFIYFGSHNPFNLKNGVCYALIALGIAGMIGTTVAGFSLITSVGEVSDTALSFIINTLLPISLIVATVCYIIAYVVWCRGLSSQWFLGIGIATTVLFPVATALIIAAFVLYIALVLIKWFISSLIILLGGTPLERGFKQGWNGTGQGGPVYQITDEYGNTRTLRQYDGNRFYDGTDFWITDDGGNTFRKDN